MSTLAKQMADEWWFKIRERTGKYWPPVNATTWCMILNDLEIFGPHTCNAIDVASAACEILKERVMNFVLAEALEQWLKNEEVIKDVKGSVVEPAVGQIREA